MIIVIVNNYLSVTYVTLDINLRRF